MVDLTKHLTRAKQSIERRNYDLALEILIECQEIDPANLELYKLLLDAAKRRAAEGGKKGLGMGLSLSKDPHKLLSGTVKKLAKNPDMKTLATAGDAAKRCMEGGMKSMVDVGILFYEEAKATGLFKVDVFWELAHLHYAKFQVTKEQDDLENALSTLAELERNMPSHGEAKRTMKNWEAMRSIAQRNASAKVAAVSGKDAYRSQLASTGEAKRNEAMNRIIRTKEDAMEVLGYVEEDLKEKPDDKSLWLKKGDIHRRIGQGDEAREAYLKAKAIDAHDFVVEMRLGDLAISEAKAKVKAAQEGNGDLEAAKANLGEVEEAEYRNRVERQPTEMSHRYNLALRLFRKGDIDGAASDFQQAVKDPRYKRQASSYLGHCFARKNLLDLARDNFTQCIELIEDDLSDEYKEARYNRARISEAMGDKPAAIDDFTAIVKADLAYKDAADRLSKLR